MSDSIEKPYEEIPIIFREYLPHNDESFLYQSWLHSFRSASKHWPFFQQMGDVIFFDEHRKMIERILRRASVVILSSPEDSGHILGYAVFEKEPESMLHYIYMKQPYRRLGLAKRLLETILPRDREIFYTHYTHAGYGVVKEWKTTFIPFWGVKEKEI